MTDRIDLTGIEVYARHGVFQFEKERAQVFRVDLTVYLDLGRAGETDDLADTVDYGALASEVREVVGGESHQLIETVAERVARVALEREEVNRVVVTVHKPDAPVDVALSDISVTIDRSR